jgi:hypothetical protein
MMRWPGNLGDDRLAAALSLDGALTLYPLDRSAPIADRPS